jgi:hypothetical protein
MKKILILLFSILISFNSLGEVVLYCTDELSTGFKYKNNKWSEVSFVRKRHTIKFNDDYSKLMGITYLDWDCTDTYADKSYNSIFCVAPYENGRTFSYHKDTKRYILIDGTTDGYIENVSGEKGTDNFRAGSCQNF